MTVVLVVSVSSHKFCMFSELALANLGFEFSGLVVNETNFSLALPVIQKLPDCKWNFTRVHHLNGPDPAHPPLRRPPEHRPKASTEVFGDEGVDHGVEAGLGVGHQVGQDPEDVGDIVEREVSGPYPEDDNVVRQPAEAEERRHHNDHFGDHPLGSPRLGLVLHGVHAGPQVANGAGVRDAQDQDGDEVAEDEGAHVHDDAASGLPDRDAERGTVQVHLWEVAEIRGGKKQSQDPNQADGGEGVLWSPYLPGAERVMDGQVPAGAKRDS